MRLVLTPRRGAISVPHGAPMPSRERLLAMIAEGRRAMTLALLRRFPEATVLGIEGKGEILVELPDDPGLVRRIRSELGVETSPPR